MSRISRGAWLTLAGALVTAVLCVVALVHVAHAAPLAQVLPGGAGERKLVVADGDGLLIVATHGAYRVHRSLAVEPIAWRPDLRIEDVRSAAWHDGALAMIVSAVDAEHAHGGDAVVLLQGDQMSVDWSTGPKGSILAVHAEGGRLVYYWTWSGGLAWTGVDHKPSPADSGQPLPVVRDFVDGMVFLHDLPLLAVSKNNRHWLVDLDGQRHKMPDGAVSVWSPSLLRPPSQNPSARPCLEEDGETEAFAEVTSMPALAVDQGRLRPLLVTRGGNEPGVFMTGWLARHIELKHTRRRLWASTGDSWRAVATSVAPVDFIAYPAGDGWIAMSDSGEAVALDGALARRDAADRSATVAALTGWPLDHWAELLAALLVAALAVPLMVARSRRVFAGLGERVLGGTLHVPPGAVVHTAGGRAELSGVCQLRATGGAIDLSSGPRRFDFASGVPLVDGDQIYVVGRVETDGDGGPLRASQRRRVVPDAGRYFIGRGTTADFARHLAARANASLFRFAVAYLAVALALLGLLGLRPNL